jgi:phage gp36-like protein
MTTKWIDKDPGDSIVVEFDFSASATGLTGTPTIAVQVSDALADPTPADILSGTVTVVGTTVRQRIVGGITGLDYFLQCTAVSSNGDTLTIESILPVRARPIVAAYVPVYLTEAQYEARFGEAELSDLQAQGTSFGQAENEAASLVDGYMAAKYALPLVSVPKIVTGWAADITRYKLWAERAPSEVRQRYDDAIKQLEQLAKGLIALPPDATGVSSSAPLSFGAFSNERVFTEDSLAGF